MKSNGIRIKAVLVAIAMVMSLSLSSCTSFMKEASLGTSTVEDNALVPVVDGFIRSDSINAKLKDTFLPTARRMAEIADDSDGKIHYQGIYADAGQHQDHGL